MNIGDAIIHRKSVSWGKKAHFGIIIDMKMDIDTIWALIMWSNEKTTWEDLKTNVEDSTFEVISESR